MQSRAALLRVGAVLIFDCGNVSFVVESRQ